MADGPSPPTLPVLRLLGVPEHFNLPWTNAVQARAFEAAGVRVQFSPVPGGSGAMIAGLLSGDADVAIALTEGIVAAVLNQVNSPASEPRTPTLAYVGEAVASPLRWMVATGASRGLRGLGDVRAAAEAREAEGLDGTIRVSVSRLGSGSHIMACLLAAREGWPTSRLSFVVHKDFRSMRRGVDEGTADVFMWEWYMTKPYVASGELVALDFLDSPWACFGLVTTRQWLDVPANQTALRAAAGVAWESCASFLREEDASCEAVSGHFGLSLEDAHNWFSGVRYPLPGRPNPLRANLPMLTGVASALASIGVVPAPPSDPASMVDVRVCEAVGASPDLGLLGLELEGEAAATPPRRRGGESGGGTGVPGVAWALAPSRLRNCVSVASSPAGAAAAAGSRRARNAACSRAQVCARRSGCTGFST